MFWQAHSSFTATTEQPVWWLVYRPAYEDRWADDLRRARLDTNVRKEVDRIRKLGCSSYTDFLESRARKRHWGLRWFDSTESLYTTIGALPEQVARLWFWGHAQKNLWLYLRHTPLGSPLSPPGTARVDIDGIKRHSGLKPSFRLGGSACFVGCNTAPFAQEWSRVFGVVANGTIGKIDFGPITTTGGVPTLLPGAKWVQYKPRARQLTR